MFKINEQNRDVKQIWEENFLMDMRQGKGSVRGNAVPRSQLSQGGNVTTTTQKMNLIFFLSMQVLIIDQNKGCFTEEILFNGIKYLTLLKRI